MNHKVVVLQFFTFTELENELNNNIGVQESLGYEFFDIKLTRANSSDLALIIFRKKGA